MEKKRKYLGTVEIFKLIDVWNEHFEELRVTRRNLHVLQFMTEQLRKEHNINLTVTELRTRIHNLTKKYRNERNRKTGPSGESTSEWRFYDAVENVLTSHESSILPDGYYFYDFDSDKSVDSETTATEFLLKEQSAPDQVSVDEKLAMEISVRVS